MSTITIEELDPLIEQVKASLAAGCQAVLATLDRLAAWCHAARVECVRSLDDEQALHRVPPTPLRSQRDTDGLARGAAVLRSAPWFVRALADGQTSAAHLDELAHCLRRLDADQQQALLAGRAGILAVACSSTSAEFARFLRREERRVGRSPSEKRLEEQQRAVRLRARTDRETGMRVFTLWCDPLSAVSFEQRLDAAVEALFHDSPPAGCPADPLERHLFLRAHALLRLSEGSGAGGRPGRPEIIVVVDADAPTGCGAGPEIDWGLPVELPPRVLQALSGRSDIVPVVVRNGVVLHAPGELQLGRSTRLANRAQRRALRAMYATCAVPGCDVHFQHCKIHHVRWWRHGGATDLGNLLPLCHRHHGNVHLDGWELQLSERRELTIILPDGTVRTTGPPRRRAA